MTHIRSRLLLATAVASLALVSVTQAQGGVGAPRPQERQGPGMMGRGPAAERMGRAGERPGGRGPRGNPAAMMLRLRSRLELTEAQVKQLEALQNAPAPRAGEADLLRARADLLEAMQGDGNLPKARAALDRMSALRNERMMAGLRQRQEARAVLTAQQKTRLDNMRSERRQRGVARGQRGARGDRRMGMGPAGRSDRRNGQFRGEFRSEFRGQPRGPLGPGGSR